MIRIVDMGFASEHLEREDIRSSIRFNESAVEAGPEQDHVALLTTNRGIHQLVETMKSMSHKIRQLSYINGL